MSWNCLEGNNTVRARKKHRCDVCSETINPGDMHVTRSGACDEGLYRMHMHLECEDHSSDWDSGDWESHSPGDISRKEVQESQQKPPAMNHYEAKRSTARKNHRCDMCKGKILAGQTYERSWSREGNETTTIRTCNQCLTKGDK